MSHPVLFALAVVSVEIMKMMNTMALCHQNDPSIAVIPRFFYSP